MRSRETQKRKPAMVSMGVDTENALAGEDGGIRLQQGRYVADRGVGPHEVLVGGFRRTRTGG